MAVHIVQQAERHNEHVALGDSTNKVWLNPSRCLVDRALERWSTTKMRADNTSVVTLMLDPPGPPRAQVLRNKRKTNTYADSGLEIMTRYEENDPTTDIDKNFIPKTRESTSFHPNEPETITASEPQQQQQQINEENIQINEISSSSNDETTKTPLQQEEVEEKPTKMNLRSTTDDSKPKKRCSDTDCCTETVLAKKQKCEKKIEEKEVTVKKRNAIRRVMATRLASEAVVSSSNSTKENIKPQISEKVEQKRNLRLKTKVLQEDGNGNKNSRTTKGIK